MMGNMPEQSEGKMKKRNEDDSKTIGEYDEKRWQMRLRAAVRAEKAPAGLRDRIGRMIREK